jgi:uncharacterized protein YkwD
MIPLLIASLASGHSALPQQQPMMHSMHHSHYQQQLSQGHNNFHRFNSFGGGYSGGVTNLPSGLNASQFGGQSEMPQEGQLPTDPSQQLPQDQNLSGDILSQIESILNGGSIDSQDGTPTPAPLPPAPTPPPTSTTNDAGTTVSESLSALEAAVLQETNNARAQNGLAPLSDDSTLDSVARAHSVDMQTKNYFNHNDLSGCSPSCRLDKVGFAWQAMGENIHMMSGFNLSLADAAKKIVNDWLNSPEHRANLLNTSYTKVGTGISQQGDAIYTTADYSLPR